MQHELYLNFFHDLSSLWIENGRLARNVAIKFKSIFCRIEIRKQYSLDNATISEEKEQECIMKRT